jgi:uncharacterized membrane protein
MPIQFTHPGYLLLLPLLLAAGWWIGRRSLASLSRTRRIVADAVRVIVLLLLTLALAGVQVVHTRHSLCTVFVLDASASVPAPLQKAALGYINQACKKMRTEDTAALVVFGGEAYIEMPPGAAAKISRIYSRPSADYTDLASALRLALASFKQGSSRQIVLLSDGNENLGSALDQALMCRTSGVHINTVGLRSKIASEALLERASLPAEVKQGEPFEMKIVATATVPAAGRIRLFRNGAYLGEQPVHLSPGKSLLSIAQSVNKPGFYTYEALLEAGPDTITENNRAAAFVQVRGKPQVLLLAGVSEAGQYLARALLGHDIEVTVQGPEGMPTSLAGWRNWDAVVFADIPAVTLTPEQMLMIQSYVRDLGGGFAMVGGEEGFGAGGYFKTPVEETLPVDMAIRKQKVFPSLAVMLIMDTSGSSGMEIDGKQMIRLEAESAIQVVETMQPIDQLGVIVSGVGVDVLAPVRYARQTAAIKRDLSEMSSGGGGIYCRPSMERALALMRPVQARTKHIIMLADGSDCDEQEGCDELAAAMRREKMTFSTVSFGIGPHTPFLERVARIGGGKFYAATRASDLPRIFTKDAMLASKSLLVEEPFLPKADPQAEILRGLDLKSMPQLLGYVATSPKALASVPLQTHKDDPLLATWRYGLGRSVAFTSDAQPHWAAHWLGWPGYGKFWSQAVRWMVKRGRPTNWNTTVEEGRGVGTVTVEALDERGEFLNFLDLDAQIVGPDLKPQTLRLEQTAPGRYARAFPMKQVGAYLVTVVPRKDSAASQTTGLAVPYPPEYKDLKPNEFLLSQLADTTGGRADPPPESIYGGARTPARYPQDIWTLLVLLAALLWPADVAVRRLVIEMSQVTAAARQVRRRAREAWGALRGGLRPQPVHQPTLGRLLTHREARKAEPQARPIALGLGDISAPGAKTPAPEPASPPREGAPVAAPTAPQPDAQEPGDALSRLKAAKRRARKEGG